MNSGSLQLRDIHPPLLLPEAADYTRFIVGFLLLLFLIGVAVWFLRFRKKKISLPFADETALLDLAGARHLMTVEQALHYATTLSAILRRYIENRFRIQTSRQTTKEFFAGLTAHPGQTAMELENHGETLHVCLDQCDLAKFARCVPDLRSMEKMEKAVQDFIEATREKRQGGK